MTLLNPRQQASRRKLTLRAEIQHGTLGICARHYAFPRHGITLAWCGRSKKAALKKGDLGMEECRFITSAVIGGHGASGKRIFIKVILYMGYR